MSSSPALFREWFWKIVDPLVFFGAVAQSLPSLFSKKGLRKREINYYLDLCGFQSVPIVILICMLMGGVTAITAALQLRKFGTEIYTADLVSFAVFKEFGPLMVAMIATGRAGSAFAAEIGTMKVNEEISALATMGIRPEAYLVLPKLIAMLVAMPLLTAIGDVAGVAGGMLVSLSYLDLPLSIYWDHTIRILDSIIFLLSMLKGAVFSVLVSLCGCYCGFSAEGDAQGVGRGATRAVVSSIFFVVIADAVMTSIYSLFGY